MSGLGGAELGRVDFAKGGGLVPAIVQHAGSARVLMLGYMNRDALAATLARGRVVLFSRSRGRLWEKGETSGHTLELAAIHADCDHDALLVQAWPRGPTCHLGSASCFGAEALAAPGAFLAELEQVIAQRVRQQSADSYTARLAASGRARIAQKVGEEAVELALAGAAGSDAQVIGEAADLCYHLLVLLAARNLTLRQLACELEARHAARPARD
jgi:phosphoribosyl-ATP pyrophosphohydrolase/phosphoribosyl-AMP cyclohydrolase